MKKWEYMSGSIPAESKEGDRRMNLLGEDGWELVSVIVTPAQVIAFFKRPIPETEVR